MRKKQTPILCKYPKIQELGYNVPSCFSYIFDTSGRISTFHDYDILRRNFRIFTTGENFWDTYLDWDDEYLIADWEEYLIDRFSTNGIPTAQLLRALTYMNLEWVCNRWALTHSGERLHERAKSPRPGEIPDRFKEIADLVSTHSIQLALFPTPTIMPLSLCGKHRKTGTA